MNDAKEQLKRQAAWQRTRAKLSWAEKINRAAGIRNDILRIREDLRCAGGNKSPEILLHD